MGRAITGVACGILAWSIALAETQKPEFEAASVRLAAPRTSSDVLMGGIWGGPGSADPGRIRCRAVTVLQVLQKVYGLKKFQISGPPWLDAGKGTSSYDVLAVIPSRATTEDFNLMLQGLLEERFHLKFHREAKDFPVNDLVVGKSGFKLKESVQTRESARKAGALPPGRMAFGRHGGGARIYGTAVPISPNLISALELQLGGFAVEDKTGLAGKYDFNLEFSSDEVVTQDEFALPSLSTVLQQDLGLQLVRKMALFDVLVIDHIDRVPTDN